MRHDPEDTRRQGFAQVETVSSRDVQHDCSYIGKHKMKEFAERGNRIRMEAKALVIEFMRASEQCQPAREGMRLAPIFRACGFDWGDYKRATSSNQQYWIVALMREIEAEGKVEQVSESGPWRLR